ncbi:Aspartyl protease family protein 1 [Linum grandiflorum]
MMIRPPSLSATATRLTASIPWDSSLHYANVSVGTPSVSFLVALDTGSDLFWLPCDCKSCVRGLQTSSGQKIDFNIYSPNASSTSESIACSNSLCHSQEQCPSPQIDCRYKVEYLDNGTSSTGVLVEDVLHLAPDATRSKSKPLEAKITFGCGQVETGSFLDGAAPNGLFGLGMSNVSVPSTLAREGYTSNSFSMCFGDDGMGRISFGDTGNSNQGETPFNLRRLHPTYNISIDQIVVGGSAEKVELSAIFDTGTSFTYLNDPAYSVITKNFDSLVKDQRHSSSSTNLPFEYCYEISSNKTEVPTLDLMMKGGQYFNLTDPVLFLNLENGGGLLYCLGLVKSGNVNIIGQNFMTGYKIVFDREKNVLGWRTSDCYANRNSNSNSNRLPIGPTSSSSIPPATAVNPEATDAGRSNTSVSGGSGCHSPVHQLTSFSFGVVIALVYFLFV